MCIRVLLGISDEKWERWRGFDTHAHRDRRCDLINMQNGICIIHVFDSSPFILAGAV